MANYTDELSQEYADKRRDYRATEAEVFSYVDSIGLAGKRVLDFGCGDGVYAPDLLKRGATEVIGIDDSPKMIGLANERFGDLKGAQFIVADGGSLPFEQNGFDFVFANFVLHHFVDLIPPLKEIFRVLKPDGQVLVTMGAYDIPDGVEVQVGAYMPVRISSGTQSTLVHNVMRTQKSVREDFESVGLKIETFESINNANTRMDDTHPYKDKVTLLTTLVIAKK